MSPALSEKAAYKKATFLPVNNRILFICTDAVIDSPQNHHHHVHHLGQSLAKRYEIWVLGSTRRRRASLSACLRSWGTSQRVWWECCQDWYWLVEGDPLHKDSRDEVLHFEFAKLSYVTVDWPLEEGWLNIMGDIIEDDRVRMNIEILGRLSQPCKGEQVVQFLWFDSIWLFFLVTFS